MPLAERSGKAAVEDQQDISFALKIGKMDFVPVEICEGEIGSRLVQFDTVGHFMIGTFAVYIIESLIYGFVL